MKKRLLFLITVLVVSTLSIPFWGCALFKKNHTIQYSDSNGNYTIEVKTGDMFTIESIPEKYGYEFLGLYDEESGGTQYINSTGNCVLTLTNKIKNLVLYPQFSPKNYTLVLDYQGANVTGARQISVSYDSKIESLPTNITMETKDFIGWFTQENGQGNQISDQYGIIPGNNIFNKTTFNNLDTDEYIYVYAGFKTKEFNVKFYFGDTSNSETISVEYGKNIADVVPETKVDGKSVLSWTKVNGDSTKIFNGVITQNLELYAYEYAPYIEFDTNGGEKQTTIVKRAGQSIILPTPIKQNYKFIEWQTDDLTSYNSNIMPEESIKLTAKWQAKLVFNENGGNDVNDISEPMNTLITLPVTEKPNYIFAGWYTENGDKYDSNVMPDTSIVLKAGYYKVIEKSVVIVSSSNEYNRIGNNTSKANTDILYNGLKLDFSNILPSDFSGEINIKGYLRIKTDSGKSDAHIYLKFYNKNQASSLNELYSIKFDVTESYKNFEYSFSNQIESNIIYGGANTNYCQYADWGLYKITDYYVIVTYPDTTTIIF